MLIISRQCGIILIMPEMYDIYKQHAYNYDELVTAEDYEDNLGQLLNKLTDWTGKTVYEAGIGTGRVTDKYIDCVQKVYGFDREKHMLSACAENLKKHAHKIELSYGDNSDLPLVADKADVFIEGWSFLHSIMDNEVNFTDYFERVYSRIRANLKPGGGILLIESLGTNVSVPAAPHFIAADFYNLLEKEYGFSRHVIRTDYKFNSFQEAARVMGFFFGDGMKELIEKQEKSIVPEYTGVWTIL